MKLCLIDKIDNSSTTQHCANRGDTWKSQLPPSERVCQTTDSTWWPHLYPFPIILSSDSQSVRSELFKCALPGRGLRESNVIFDWGHRGTLRNVFWGIDAQTVDTPVTVQVCQCYLVQQLCLEFLRRANDLPERIHAWSSTLRMDIMTLASQ